MNEFLDNLVSITVFSMASAAFMVLAVLVTFWPRKPKNSEKRDHERID